MSFHQRLKALPVFLSVAFAAGCSADLFNTPSEIRGVWKTDRNGLILDIRERSVAVYRNAADGCSLLRQEDFAGPRFSKWEIFMDGSGDGFQFREPGSSLVVRATRLNGIPSSCIARSYQST